MQTVNFNAYIDSTELHAYYGPCNELQGLLHTEAIEEALRIGMVVKRGTLDDGTVLYNLVSGIKINQCQPIDTSVQHLHSLMVNDADYIKAIELSKDPMPTINNDGAFWDGVSSNDLDAMLVALSNRSLDTADTFDADLARSLITYNQEL